MNGMMRKVVDSVYSNAGKMPVIIFFHGAKKMIASLSLISLSLAHTSP